MTFSITEPFAAEWSRRVKLLVVLVTAFALILPASIALATNESGSKTCGTNDHVYTKINYSNGYTRSIIDEDSHPANYKVHETIPLGTWVNRYHQPRLGNNATYQLQDYWLPVGDRGDMNNTLSWPGCED